MILFLFCYLGAAGQEIPRWKLADLEKTISNLNQPLILNFWATFCKPCLEELPYFQELSAQYKDSGLKLVLVSLDLPDYYGKIKSFTQKHHIITTIVYLDETNADLFCPVVNKDWSGSIPATLLINHKTNYRKFFESKISKSKVEAEIRSSKKYCKKYFCKLITY
jgi:thiol-disulfide isomerase/thioredoxin